jgi:hypothetical protein
LIHIGTDIPIKEDRIVNSYGRWSFHGGGVTVIW